jgi:uncharacterized membrane protein
MKKDFQQITILFLFLLITSLGLFLFYTNKSFNGLCKNPDFSTYSTCTYWESVNSTILVISLFWFGAYLFLMLLVFLIRKLNKHGFNINSFSWERILVIPIFFSLGKAIVNIYKNTPVEDKSIDGKDNSDITH